MKIKTLNSSSKDFYFNLSEHVNLKIKNTKAIENSVIEILNDINKNKDKALIKFAKKYDSVNYSRVSDSLVSKKEIENAYKSIPSILLKNIKKSITNIKKFSRRQVLKSWSIKKKMALLLGKK